MTKTIRISFGVLAPTIKKQLKEQGFSITEKQEKIFSNIKESILHLYFSGLITETEKHKITNKFLKLIAKELGTQK